MVGPPLSISKFKNLCLYNDQVNLVKSVCADTVKRTTNNRYVFWGSWISFVLLKRAVRELGEFKCVVQDYQDEELYLKDLSSFPNQPLWIFINSIEENVFNSTPVDNSIYFVYLRGLKEEYSKIIGLKNWIKNASPVHDFTQDFQKM